MTNIASIVEGDGEVAALPILLRRIGKLLTPERYAQVLPPIRVHRDRFLNRDDEFRRHILLAAAKCGDDGWILILLDADDDCPAQRGSEILNRAHQIAPHRRISVVLANREYEAWFLAAAESLHGHRGFSFETPYNLNPELPRDAKGWMRERMASSAYRPRTDQPAFSAVFDLMTAQGRSRSFRKLCDEWQRQMRGIGFQP